jgi:glycosyltransferase involved in cell wall biosynthesis
MSERIGAALRRFAARLKRSEKVRELVFPLLRRSPVAAMAVGRLLQRLNGDPWQLEWQAEPGELTGANESGAARSLTEPARRVLADLQLRIADEGGHARSPGRPRIAIVSPLPPLKSGVAFHAADLVPELAHDFDVELVAVQPLVDDPRLAAFALRSPAWLRANAAAFDEIVYHVGNSGMHDFVFELLADHPGVVVLHDVYLSNVLNELDSASPSSAALLRGLYDSHGWPALAELARAGRAAAIWKYPASLQVLQRATCVVVHSQHAVDLVAAWFGPQFSGRCKVVPLLRHFPPAPARPEARAQLGIGADEFVVCNFGLLGPTKCNAELLEAFLASPLADDPKCSLVFVGEDVPNEYGAEMDRRMRSHKRRARVRVTGFVSPSDYSAWLAACDMAVQLRRRSRGETSAAVLDCLGHGVPTIVNAHGSAADLDDGLVLAVPEDFTAEELAQAIGRMHADSALRQRLGAAGAAHVRTVHGPDAVRAGYRDALARSPGSPMGVYRESISGVARENSGASPERLQQLAADIAARQPRQSPPQLLVDVSAVVKTDLGTGIQRVVRELVRQWLAQPPAGFRVEPVYSPGAGQPWRYARRYAARMLRLPSAPRDDAIADMRHGDVFIGLDLHPSLIADNEALLARVRASGVRIFFTVYDLLPVRMPQAFPPGTDAIFERWLRTVSHVADGVVAISRASADDFAAWIAANPPEREKPVDIGFFRLGADLTVPSKTRLGWSASRALRRATASPALLMVGTIEPRKGHRQALDAAELLWNRGADVNLVIVGKAGWMMDDVVARLKSHPLRNRRLFWFGHASDALLRALYRQSAGLLAASEGEGFGLPLIEGANEGLALVARDLPVFREVAGDHAWYFDGREPQALADSIERWLQAFSRGEHPKPERVPRVTWSDSAKSFEDAALGGAWLRRWTR